MAREVVLSKNNEIDAFNQQMKDERKTIAYLKRSIATLEKQVTDGRFAKVVEFEHQRNALVKQLATR